MPAGFADRQLPEMHNGSALLPEADLAVAAGSQMAAPPSSSEPAVAAAAAGTHAGLPPRHPPTKQDAAVAAAAAAAAAGGSAAGLPGSSGGSAAAGGQQAGPGSGSPSRPPRPQGSTDHGPFTFASPFEAAAELRSAAGTAQRQQHPQRQQQHVAGAPAGQPLDSTGSGERRPSGVLRGAGPGDAARPKRTVSWSDFQSAAPLAQVVEYEPSEGRSARSDDDWGGHSSGCMCCIQ